MSGFDQHRGEEASVFGGVDAPLHGEGSDLVPMHPTTVIERMERDRDQLLQGMTIIPESFNGVRESNMVTQREFDRMAADYASIRHGDGDLTVTAHGFNAADTDQRRAAAMTDVRRILQTPSGRQLIHELNHQPRHHHTTVDSSFANPHTDFVGPNTLAATNGHGGDSDIAYDPTEQPVFASNEAWDPVRSDVTLYHELVHAEHWGNGDEVDGAITAADGGTERDLFHRGGRPPVARGEYQATGLGRFRRDPFSENRYRNERRSVSTAEQVAGDATMPDRDNYLGDGVRELPHP
jgi:hypothetical protein